MKTYTKQKFGGLKFEGKSMPVGHPTYLQALAEVESGKAEIVAYVKSAPVADHQGYLDSTDWYVIRFLEEGVPVPLEVTAQRQTARASI